MQNLTSTPTGLTVSVPAARLSLGSSGVAIALLAVLHVLSPEFDPTWRMVSEYAFGEYGWVLGLMFFTWCLSTIVLFFAIKSQIRTLGGKIGLGFLLASGVGMGMAILFDARHALHGLATLIGIPSLPIAAMLISVSLGRNQAWKTARRTLLLTANLTWISLGLMVAMVFIGLSKTGGEFTPDVLVGWPNRLLIVAYSAWVMVTAQGAIQVDRQ